MKSLSLLFKSWNSHTFCLFIVGYVTYSHENCPVKYPHWLSRGWETLSSSLAPHWIGIWIQYPELYSSLLTTQLIICCLNPHITFLPRWCWLYPVKISPIICWFICWYLYIPHLVYQINLSPFILIHHHSSALITISHSQSPLKTAGSLPFGAPLHSAAAWRPPRCCAPRPGTGRASRLGPRGTVASKLSVYLPILVGGFNPSEKYYIVSWDDYSQYTEK